MGQRAGQNRSETMKKVLFFTLLVVAAVNVKAQSADYAKSLISSGRDGEAARVIRVLAERGDAEGQYLLRTFMWSAT